MPAPHLGRRTLALGAHTAAFFLLFLLLSILLIVFLLIGGKLLIAIAAAARCRCKFKGYYQGSMIMGMANPSPCYEKPWLGDAALPNCAADGTCGRQAPAVSTKSPMAPRTRHQHGQAHGHYTKPHCI